MDVDMAEAGPSSGPPTLYIPNVKLDEPLYSTSYPIIQDIPVGQPIVDWKYEMRRETQEILPNLYLGPFQISKQLDELKRLGVTHIVCIRDTKEAFLVKPRFPDQFIYLTLDVSDHEDQNLIRIFPQTRQFIANAIAVGGTVFVHCNGGISLGPSVVVGYVMAEMEMTFEQAMKWVQGRRYCISPNAGFMTQLKEYEPIYKASRAASMAAAASNGMVGSGESRRKRKDEDSDEEDEETNVEGNEMANSEPRDHIPARRHVRLNPTS